MHIVFAALNAKYIHSSLACACLCQACRGPGRSVSLHEYTINENTGDILADLACLHPDVLCFSCYIWNIETILRIASDFKKVQPGCLIILGGPEASFSPGEILNDCQAVDAVVQGEGEITLPEVLAAWQEGLNLDNIKGVAFRRQGMIANNPPREPAMDMNMPNPAYDELMPLEGRILYYETSRGCPFNCSFCLSSAQGPVRWRRLENVEQDLKYLMKLGAREIKFVDRTFNADEVRARKIMEFILKEGKDGTFHFEIRAELMSDEFIDFLKTVPAGRFNFEIGVQSTCAEALRAVKRPSNWEKVRVNIARLRSETRIHIHLDLIAGLPHEDYSRFRKSFNDVLALQPHMLQLGFLKMLKGTALRESAGQYGYIFQEHPPYQILNNDFITYYELHKLQQIEELLEIYYNSGVFKRILRYINSSVYPGDFFAFFESFSQYWLEQGLFRRNPRREKSYAILLDYLNVLHPRHRMQSLQIIKIDYLENQGPQRLPHDLPAALSSDCSTILYGWLQDSDFVMNNLPELQGLRVGERRRRVHLEYVTVHPQTLQECSEPVPVLFVYPPGRRRAGRIICL